MFLLTNDGLIGRPYIIAIGPLEKWPNGWFHKITYQRGRDALETRARQDDVDDFLTEAA